MTRLHNRHGQRSHPLYSTWKGMRQRCSDPNQAAYARYGAVGIRVCPEWNDFGVFLTWALSAGWSPGLTLDRRENAGGYEPGNCRWATPREQAANSRKPRLITAFGETKNLTEWSRDPRCVVTRRAIIQRLDSGLTPEQAITSPDRRGAANRRRSVGNWRIS